MALQKFLLLFVLIFSTPADASKYIEIFCEAEFKKLCKDAPGAFQCLKKFENERSPKCNAAFKAYEKEFNNFFGPCLNEKANTCKNIEPGKGLVQPCLEKIAGSVSSACAKHINSSMNDKFPDLPFESQVVCAKELKKYCSKIKYGNRRLSSCLSHHYEKIDSPECKSIAGQLLQ